MPRHRLTRQDSREQTRQHLLDAAATVIAHRGFATTTVEDIVEHAGYTRGAFYSNFHSRLELFAELLKRNHAGMKNSLRHLLDSSLCEQELTCDHKDMHLMLWIEARHHAMRDPALRHHLDALTLELRDVMVCSINTFCRRMNIRPPMAPDALALTLMALIEGSLYFRINMSADLHDDSLRATLRNAVLHAAHAG